MDNINEKSTNVTNETKDILVTPKGDRITAISEIVVRRRIEQAFRNIENSPGAHGVIDTQWSKLKEDMSHHIDSIDLLIDQIYGRDGEVAILDEGCGSSLTIFEATEDIEQHVQKGVKVKSFGITASPDILTHPVSSDFKTRILDDSPNHPSDKSRLELALNGVQYSEQEGYYRMTPGGNTIHFLKADAHFLETVFPDQKFDLIYSHAAYPHFISPWLAFERACNKLKSKGLLLIDSMSANSILDVKGINIDLDRFFDILRRSNPGYRIQIGQNRVNPFVYAVALEKVGTDNFYTGLNFAVLTKPGFPTQLGNLVGIYSEDRINQYVPFAGFK